LVYRCVKQRGETGSDKRGAEADELHLTPLRTAAVAMAGRVQAVPSPTQSAPYANGEGVPIQPEPVYELRPMKEAAAPFGCSGFFTEALN